MMLHSQACLRHDIDQVLADLEHLNLSGSVRYDLPKWPVARGGFGEVYRGTCANSSAKIAIKCLTVYLDGSRDTLGIFRRELKAWSRLKHPNIIPLLGFMLEETGDPHVVSPSLISEWMEQGHVSDFVRRNPQCNIVRLTAGMASGLAYLHEQNIVHSDFKSTNVLVSTSLEAVICDFGSSHITHTLTKSSDVTGIRGTSRWIAYELLAQPDKYTRATKASDTWAFGMTVYEIMTNGFPYAEISLESQVLISIVARKLPSYPTDLREEYKKRLWDICTACWSWDPNERPTMAEISDLVGSLEEASQPVAEHVSDKVPEVESAMKPWAAKHWWSELPQLNLTSIITQMSSEPSRSWSRVNDFYAMCNGIKVTVRRNHDSIVPKNISKLARASPHPNVEELLGYAFKQGDYSAPSLVFRFVGTQDAQTYVKNNPQCNVASMALQIARGLAYLHDHDLIHGCLRASSIIVSEEGTPSISQIYHRDVLSSQDDSYSQEFSGSSIRWIAIEIVLGSTSRFTKRTDIWAFGMTIYELLSGHVPYSHVEFDLPVITVISERQLPPCPEAYDSWPVSRKSVWAICRKCWEMDPSARPSVDKLVRAFEGVLAIQDVTEM